MARKYLRYALTVFQTIDDDAETGRLAGQREISGAIEVNPGQRMVDLSGKHFTLETNDGRCLEACARQGDPVSRHWEIVGSGRKGLEPC